MKSLPVFLALVALAQADIYMQNPRGSNNRLNEDTANRKNANRLFDSQNNDKGGYNVGEKTVTDAEDEFDQYNMAYFQSSAISRVSDTGEGDSYLTIEWTNQHGCGSEQKSVCNVVLQYMCQQHEPELYELNPDDRDPELIRNGRSRLTSKYSKKTRLNENLTRAQNRYNSDVELARGKHEPWTWYDKCFTRERNGGLFTADQNLKSDNRLGYSSAIYTRQNPNGGRSGYECPEERDYYPYWHPTPWTDIAILGDSSKCEDYYELNSFNVRPYHECIYHWDEEKTHRKHYARHNNQANCEAGQGTWTALYNYLEKAPEYNSESKCGEGNEDGIELIWGIPYDSEDARTPECLVALPAPHCGEAPTTRTNHLGNARDGDGEPSRFTWKIPHFPSGERKRCVLRARYNISTTDYDVWNTDSSSNGDASPVTEDPVVTYHGVNLQLPLDTDQTGRTFQDRSHVFILEPRPDDLDVERIFNLNVKGKRGNIVQTFPATEYDFHPNDLEIRTSDLVHIQWTGSNSHDNKNNGAAGQGEAGTDRHNLVPIDDLGQSYPVEDLTMWSDAEVKWIFHGNTDISAEDLAVTMASSGFYHCRSGCDFAVDNAAETLETKLQNASPSFAGVLLRFANVGEHNYMCSRNHQFTNRDQKGKLRVVP